MRRPRGLALVAGIIISALTTACSVDLGPGKMPSAAGSATPFSSTHVP